MRFPQTLFFITPLNPVAQQGLVALVAYATNTLSSSEMMFCRSLFIVPALIATLLPAPNHAQDWPRFRGADGNGVGKIAGLPAEITKADYEWAIKLDGIGHSSPILWGDRLFLTSFNKDSGERRVECYDCASGMQEWNWVTPVAEHNLHKYNNFASSTPVANAAAVFIVWGSGKSTEAIALSHDGKELWKREWTAFTSDHGFAASPIIVDDVLIFHTDSVEEKHSQVMGLDPATGETIWELERVTEGEDDKHVTSYSTPTVLNVGGVNTVVVFQTNDGWKGLAPGTGEVAWEYAGDYNLRSVGSIVSDGEMVFTTVGSGGKGKVATALKPGKSSEPKVLYELGIADGLGYVPTPLIHDGLLYLWGDGGVLTCRNAKNGEQVYEERISGNFFSSPVIADGKIYCGSRDGELVAVALGKKFEIVGRSHLDSGMNATPAIAKNRMFLRTDTHLISILGK
ncbi:MAG: PQQ-binding-like beta-propeller repeat protein [Verrucomicrobiales bacterium]|nr:PQQ-binding-like beta-propeller repeat protein [Verrucomicrobiales bacterium]